jgi:hypothetical protein
LSWKEIWSFGKAYDPSIAANALSAVLEAWNAQYDCHNEVAWLMLGSMSPELQYAKGQYVSSYVLKRKSYLGQLECLNYVLPLTILVGLIHNFFPKDFVGF